MVASLIEIIFHDNLEDVNDYLSKIEEIAKAIALGIYEEFNIPYYIEPIPEPIINNNWLDMIKSVSPYWQVWEKFVNEHPEVNLKGLIVKLYNHE